MKEPDGPVDDDKGDRQQWVVDNCEPADFQLDEGSHVLCQAQGGVFPTYRHQICVHSKWTTFSLATKALIF